METFSKRLATLMEYEKVSQNGLARALNVSSATINRFIHGTAMPSFEVIQSLKQAYPKYNLTWIVMGEGEIFLDGSTPTQYVTAEEHYGIVTELKKEIQELNATIRRILLNLPESNRSYVGKTQRNPTQRPEVSYTIIEPVTGMDVTYMVFPGSVQACA